MTVFDAQLPSSVEGVNMRNREWIITNGLGGHASGTLAGVCTRKYHGAFVPNLLRPRGRHVLISRLDEEFVFLDRQVVIGGADFAADSFQDANARWLQSFQLEGNIARWVYDFGGLILQKVLVMPHQQNTAVAHYEILRGPAATLRLRPYLAFRRQDGPLNQLPFEKFDVKSVGEGRYEFTRAGSELTLRMTMQPPRARFTEDTAQVRDQLLWREQLRGYEHFESALSPGYFETKLEQGRPIALISTVEAWTDLPPDSEDPFQAERARIAELIDRAGAHSDPFLARLVVAADQFLILPQNRFDENVEATLAKHPLRTVVAGYHWFLDWGRDTMISLEGLMLSTRRFPEARATLLTFSHYVRDGLLPNLFPEESGEGRYHTVDASLWYFHAIHRYVQVSGDTALLEELLPVLRTIMRCHLDGTRFNIGVDPVDGLLAASASVHALTWMDAHMGDWIVTPRRGKPVEIQALWYNALRLMQRWEPDEQLQREYEQRAALARTSFNTRFWNESRQCLFDVIDGEQGDDARLRPNQIFAISLDHPILEPARWRAVLDTVERELLTPVGLRTLDRHDPAYVKNYHGNLRSRDAAYHQGTVWPWLLGGFIEAWLKVHGDRQRARAMLAAFPAHLDSAGIGTISEVFDGDWPHEPHGCIAQAWSVAEILRAWKLTCTRAR
jgi:predicted glycogen debranching enzyme